MIYLDNAATTPLDKRVAEEMKSVMDNFYGNPSSVHRFGRDSKVLIEKARKTIASAINASPAEIVFTSGGTEAINTAISSVLNSFEKLHIITSKIEHHAVINTVNMLSAKSGVVVSYVKLKNDGSIDLDDLIHLLEIAENPFVILNHANNEIGNILPAKDVADICKKYNAKFLCDTVQTMGKYKLDMQKMSFDYAVCSAHKLYGPKGVGFLYVNENSDLFPLLRGGGQERKLRAGTENIYGIVGMAKAFEVAHEELDENSERIKKLKDYLVAKLQQDFDDVRFHGSCSDMGLYTIVNVSFPVSPKSEMLQNNLDIAGIAVSGQSACNSGTTTFSYVLEALGCDSTRPVVRFSLGKYNTIEELDESLKILKKCL